MSLRTICTAALVGLCIYGFYTDKHLIFRVSNMENNILTVAKKSRATFQQIADSNIDKTSKAFKSEMLEAVRQQCSDMFVKSEFKKAMSEPYQNLSTTVLTACKTIGVKASQDQLTHADIWLALSDVSQSIAAIDRNNDLMKIEDSKARQKQAMTKIAEMQSWSVRN